MFEVSLLILLGAVEGDIVEGHRPFCFALIYRMQLLTHNAWPAIPSASDSVLNVNSAGEHAPVSALAVPTDSPIHPSARYMDGNRENRNTSLHMMAGGHSISAPQLPLPSSYSNEDLLQVTE